MQINKNDLISQIERHRDGAYKYRERRHDSWDEIYELYRDRVRVNRITQRQSVNLPLMKETVRTILAKNDDPTELVFKERGNNKEKELYLNEYWKEWTIIEKYAAKDQIDKKQELLAGRSFIKLNFGYGRPLMTVEDCQDLLVDRYCDPADIETANFIRHEHIYKTLDDLKGNAIYDQDAVTRLASIYSTGQGMIVAQANAESAQQAVQRMQAMGDTEADAPTYGATIVEISENYLKLWDEEEGMLRVLLAVMGGQELLYHDWLENILGVNFYPFITWADDIEKLDFWSDGVGDVVKTPNKILNAYFSQMIENRTLRNFGMNFYDKTAAEDFTPQTFIPRAWGWYGLPGKPNEVYRPVEVPLLTESINEMQFIIGSIERATAATAIEKGTGEKKQITLGEVQLLAAKANERIESHKKFYKPAREELGRKWVAIVNANVDKMEPITLYKKSYKGNMFEKKLDPKELFSKDGYDCEVLSKSEFEENQLQELQKLNAVAGKYPANTALQKLLEKKMLEMTNLSQEEIKEVIEFEERMMQTQQAPPELAGPVAPVVTQPVAV